MKHINNHLKKSMAVIAIFGGLSMPAITFAGSDITSMVDEATISSKLVEARMALRDLMLDHIFWARSAVIGSVDNDNIAFTVADQRAMENAKNIAKFAETYCGAEKAAQFQELFSGHYTSLVEYVKAMNSENVSATEAAEKAIYVNSENLATFLSTENEFIKKDEFTTAFNLHIQQHLNQIKFIKAEDYESEAKLWTEMKMHAYEMADYLVNAVAQKYPDKF